MITSLSGPETELLSWCRANVVNEYDRAMIVLRYACWVYLIVGGEKFVQRMMELEDAPPLFSPQDVVEEPDVEVVEMTSTTNTVKRAAWVEVGDDFGGIFRSSKTAVNDCDSQGASTPLIEVSPIAKESGQYLQDYQARSTNSDDGLESSELGTDGGDIAAMDVQPRKRSSVSSRALQLHSKRRRLGTLNAAEDGQPFMYQSPKVPLEIAAEADITKEDRIPQTKHQTPVGASPSGDTMSRPRLRVLGARRYWQATARLGRRVFVKHFSLSRFGEKAYPLALEWQARVRSGEATEELRHRSGMIGVRFDKKMSWWLVRWKGPHGREEIHFPLSRFDGCLDTAREAALDFKERLQEAHPASALD
ncbi:MAG: uncharacterized protein KVP18_002043 [Porospora cf. gigantea A]|uniref:uncharacterized protein n=1 Tax=Porospora cf. gigantea A TaxID=2853593 RepID=UPI00355A3F42|nr:MAG: hypothetical protein KVP18_002043 [Porospora cf. gigantea A]